MDGGQYHSPCFCVAGSGHLDSCVVAEINGEVVDGMVVVLVVGMVAKVVVEVGGEVGCKVEIWQSSGPLEHPEQEKSTLSQEENK